MQFPVSVVKEIDVEFYGQACQVFISWILDLLQKQFDQHQVTAGNNFEVRLTQKFLFFRWVNETPFYHQKCPLSSFYTFCGEMGCESFD